MVKNLELNLSYFRIRCLETLPTTSKHAVVVAVAVAVVEITKRCGKNRTKDKAAIKMTVLFRSLGRKKRI